MQIYCPVATRELGRHPVLSANFDRERLFGLLVTYAIRPVANVRRVNARKTPVMLTALVGESRKTWRAARASDARIPG